MREPSADLLQFISRELELIVDHGIVDRFDL
jgi:hypothetical protein